MSLRAALRRNERGAAMLEFALLAPVLLTVVIGAVQMGILFFANTGLQHAVGEGARLAAIFPRPTDTEIRERITSSLPLDEEDAVGEPEIEYRQRGTNDVADISWSYRVQLDFVFFQTPPVTLTHSRTVYLQPAGTT